MKHYSNISDICVSSIKKIILYDKCRNTWMSQRPSKISKRWRKKLNITDEIGFTQALDDEVYTKDELLSKLNTYVTYIGMNNSSNFFYDFFYRPHIRFEYTDGSYDEFIAPHNDPEEEMNFIVSLYDQLIKQVTLFKLPDQNKLVL